MKKVALVRGPALSKWEAQIYEPLTTWFDIVAIGSTKPINDTNNIRFPIKQLVCPSQIGAKLPYLVKFMFHFFGDTQYLLGFENAIKNCDLIHTVELRSAFSLQAIRAKQKGLVKAVTATIYENIPFIYDSYPARKKLKEEVLKYTDHFFAANEMAKQCLLLEGANEEKISIVPQSVDTKIFFPASKGKQVERKRFRKELGIDEDDFLVLSVGRMVWEKGWFDIIPAAAKVKTLEGDKIKFLLIGAGHEVEQIKKLIKQACLKNTVIYLGSYQYRKMSSIFNAADLFLYPPLPTRYWNAQFGGVLIEAMATGLPIVGTLSGGVRDDTVGKQGGIFVQPQHFSALADAILKLYKNKKIYYQISRRNRAFAVKNYDTFVVAKQIKQIWKKVLKV